MINSIDFNVNLKAALRAVIQPKQEYLGTEAVSEFER